MQYHDMTIAVDLETKLQIKQINQCNSILLQGFYTYGQDVGCLVPDVIRKEAERCESLAGFQLLHSTGGGTGAGLGASLLRKINDEYPDRILSTVSVFSSS